MFDPSPLALHAALPHRSCVPGFLGMMTLVATLGACGNGSSSSDDTSSTPEDTDTAEQDTDTDTDTDEEEAPPFDPSISVSYSARAKSTDVLLVTDTRSYSGDEVSAVSCAIDDRGLRLLMTAPTPDCGDDAFRVLMYGYIGPEEYTWNPSLTTPYGSWTAYSPPRLRAKGQTGCFDRPILPRSQTIVATEDEWGRVTLEVSQSGSTAGNSSADYKTSTTFTLKFDPATCTLYDSGDPACTGATGEDLGAGRDAVYATACEAILPGPICDDTPECSTNSAGDACEGSTLVDCADLPNDDLACITTFPCVP